MSDLLTDERIRTAFAELRAGEQPQICPPGADAARRTVRSRRRRGAAAAAAGMTALVAVGAGYLAGAGGQRGTTEPASVASEAPTMPAAGLQQQELDYITLSAVGDPPPGARYLAIAGGPVRQGDRHPSRLTLPVDLSGSYLLRVSCGDRDGAVTVAVQAGGEEATATARCGTTADEVTAGIGEATLVVAGRDPEARIRVEPDEAAVSDGSRPVVAITLIPR